MAYTPELIFNTVKLEKLDLLTLNVKTMQPECKYVK